MRTYKDSFGHEFDLDEEETYSHLPKEARALDDRMFKEIGYALCYMDNFHPEDFPVKGRGQRQRVELRIHNFCENRMAHYEDVIWLREQVFLFEDETENMC